MKGVILDLDTLSPNDLLLDNLYAQLDDWDVYPFTEPHDVQARIETADVVLTNKVKMTADIIEKAGGLKLIGAMATGTDNIDLAAASLHGVTVCNAVSYSTPSVVQHTFSLLLALCTRLLDYTHAVSRGDWQQSRLFCLLDYPVQELAGKKLGIIGYGHLGKKVAAVAQAFDMDVLVANSYTGEHDPYRVELDYLMANADVISLHCPLTEDTRYIINADSLRLMKPEALLINTARGALIDESALADALIAKQIAGAGIDVLSSEPPDTHNVLLQSNIPNLIVTPHTAWASRESRQRLVEQLADVVASFRGGTPKQVVN